MLFVVSRPRIGHTSVMGIRYLTCNYTSVLKVQSRTTLEPFGLHAYIDFLFPKSVLMALSDLIIRLSGFLPVLVGCFSSFLSLTSSA